MSKKAVYVRGPDNVYYRKEKTPSLSSGSSESIGRSTSEVDHTLNELMECGFRIENKPEPTDKKSSEILPKGKPTHDHRHQSPQPNAQIIPAYSQSPADSIMTLHPYTKDWRDKAPPFLAGMVSTYLLQLGLPSIQYYMGALATLLKWTVIWCALIGGALVYAGAFPSMAEIKPLLDKIGPGGRFRPENFGRPNLESLGGVSPDNGSQYTSESESRPPVPSKTSPDFPKYNPDASKKEDASITNVKAFQAQLRHSPRLAGNDIGRSEAVRSEAVRSEGTRSDGSRSEGGSSSNSIKSSHDPRAPMRRAFTEGVSADSGSSSSLGRLAARRKSDFGGTPGNDVLRNSKAIGPKHAKVRPSAPNRPQSASSLSYGAIPDDIPNADADSAPDADNLPFLFEMKMKDSDHFSLRRSDTTTTKNSVLGTRANYSKFLANVDH